MGSRRSFDARGHTAPYAQQMLMAALLAEVAAYIEQFADQVDEAGVGR